MALILSAYCRDEPSSSSENSISSFSSRNSRDTISIISSSSAEAVAVEVAVAVALALALVIILGYSKCTIALNYSQINLLTCRKKVCKSPKGASPNMAVSFQK